MRSAGRPDRSRLTIPDAVRLAVGTLTAVPIPAPRRVSPTEAGRAMLLAPIAAVVPGAMAAGAVVLADLTQLSAAVAAALAIAAAALTTRGMHLDGLADSADGLAASFDRDRALEVMRRGDVGPTGVATLVLVLLVQFTALTQVAGRGGAWAVLVAVVASRLAVPLACLRGVPPARPEGLGAQVAGTVGRLQLALTGAATAAAGTLVMAAAGSAWWAGGAAVLAATAASGVVVVHAVRRLGGITGDVIGAAVELAFAASLVTLAASR